MTYPGFTGTVSASGQLSSDFAPMRPSAQFPIRPVVTLLAFVIAATAQAQTTRRKLVERTVVDGVTCGPTARAYAEFHASGRLSECPIASDTTIAGHRFFAGTWLRFDETGVLFAGWLSRDTELNGITCRGDGYKEWSVRFHPNGQLELCYLRVDSEIEGIPCIRGTFWNEIRGGTRTSVWFGRDGKLARCQASRAFTARGHSYKKWETFTAAVQR
jgi:hypothetical protein